jgi:hypothetical protein
VLAFSLLPRIEPRLYNLHTDYVGRWKWIGADL